MRPSDFLQAFSQEPLLRTIRQWLRMRQTSPWRSFLMLWQLWKMPAGPVSEQLHLLLAERAAFKARAEMAEAEVFRLRTRLSEQGDFVGPRESRKRYVDLPYWPMVLR